LEKCCSCTACCHGECITVTRPHDAQELEKIFLATPRKDQTRDPAIRKSMYAQDIWRFSGQISARRLRRENHQG